MFWTKMRKECWRKDDGDEKGENKQNKKQTKTESLSSFSSKSKMTKNITLVISLFSFINNQKLSGYFSCPTMIKKITSYFWSLRCCFSYSMMTILWWPHKKNSVATSVVPWWQKKSLSCYFSCPNNKNHSCYFSCPMMTKKITLLLFQLSHDDKKNHSVAISVVTWWPEKITLLLFQLSHYDKFHPCCIYSFSK